MTGHQQELFATSGQARDQHVAAQVTVLLERDDRAQEGEPDEQPARNLLADGDAGVERVAQHHVAEHQHHHHRQGHGDQHLQQAAIAVDDFSHLVSFRRSLPRLISEPRRRAVPPAAWLRGPTSLTAYGLRAFSISP
ncbi:hypothetical protein D9M68_896400 [compost metagenome]